MLNWPMHVVLELMGVAARRVCTTGCVSALCDVTNDGFRSGHSLKEVVPNKG